MVVSLGLFAWFSSPALAGSDTCKDVVIKVENKLSKEITVQVIEFYDFDKEKWREELLDHTLGVHRIAPGESKTYLRNLQAVKNDGTKIKVQFTKPNGNLDHVTGEKHTCKDGEVNTLTVQ